MRCSHCLEDSRPDTAQHMTRATFAAALDCTDRVEGLARQMTGYNLLLFSGGECTEHPDILDLLDTALAREFRPLLITNGLWLSAPVLAPALLARAFSVQVTNDPRFYPKVVYIDALSSFTRLGRGARGSAQGVRERPTPGSFNLRSFTRAFGDVRLALVEHRRRALTMVGGHCTPTISWDGMFVVGESRFCSQVGTVHSTPEQITEGILRMGSCDRCGTERNLGAAHRAAIGL